MIASHSKAQIWFAYPPRAASRENTLLPWIASFLLHVGFKDSLRYLIHLARWFSKRNKRISIWRVFEMHLTHLTSADWGKCCAPLSPPKFLPMETYGNQLLIILQKWDAGMPQKWENHRCFNGKFIYIYIHSNIYSIYIYIYIYIHHINYYKWGMFQQAALPEGITMLSPGRSPQGTKLSEEEIVKAQGARTDWLGGLQRLQYLQMCPQTWLGNPCFNGTIHHK